MQVRKSWRRSELRRAEVVLKQPWLERQMMLQLMETQRAEMSGAVGL